MGPWYPGRWPVKKLAARIFLAALIAIALVYTLKFCGGEAGAMHTQSARGVRLACLYRGLCAYRERNGRWPQTLREAVDERGSSLRETDILDPILPNRPLIYYPDAKPGTKAILVERPEPLEVGLWPFIVTHRRAIRADGRLVDLHGDEREVDDSKLPGLPRTVRPRLTEQFTADGPMGAD